VTKMILIVDDEPLVLMGVEAMVESLGFETVAVSNGNKALEILQSDADIAAMITDQTMPNLSGKELIDAARILNMNLPIVIMTGRSDMAKDAGSNTGLIQKPFSTSELESALSAVLEASNQN
jgi:CheY-like chemotaxis protein